MANIRVRQALERIQAELNKVGEHAAQYSGISRKDASSVKWTCEDIAKTAMQIAELAEHPVD
jgi:hypothetical protein